MTTEDTGVDTYAHLVPPFGVEKLSDAALVRILGVLAREVATQDNRMTSYPRYVVREKTAIRGVDPDAHGDVVRHYMEHGREVEPEDAAEAARWADGNYGGRYIEISHSTHYWKPVVECFTKKGADEYIARHAHNLGETHVYVGSGYMNIEWQLVREFFLRFGKTGQMPMAPWRSIESAPRDGTEILLRRGNQRFTGYFRAEESMWYGGPCRYSENDGVTHWMPLAEVPA